MITAITQPDVNWHWLVMQVYWQVVSLCRPFQNEERDQTIFWKLWIRPLKSTAIKRKNKACLWRSVSVVLTTVLCTFKMHFIISLSSTPSSRHWSLPLKLCNWTFESHLSPPCPPYIPSHSLSWSYNSNWMKSKNWETFGIEVLIYFSFYVGITAKVMQLV